MTQLDDVEWEELIGALRQAAPSHGMAYALDLYVRAMLVLTFHELVHNEHAQADLARRMDFDFPHSSINGWRETVADVVQQFLREDSPDGVRVILGYPVEDANWPVISIVKQSDAEDDGMAVAGDWMETIRTPRLDATKAQREAAALITPPPAPGAEGWFPQGVVVADDTIIKGIGETSTIEVGVWTTNPVASVILESAVRMVLLVHREITYDSAILEYGARSGGFMPDDRIPSRVSYVPTTTLTVKWERAHAIRRPGRLVRYTTAAGSFT